MGRWAGPHGLARATAGGQPASLPQEPVPHAHPRTPRVTTFLLILLLIFVCIKTFRTGLRRFMEERRVAAAASTQEAEQPSLEVASGCRGGKEAAVEPAEEEEEEDGELCISAYACSLAAAEASVPAAEQQQLRQQQQLQQQQQQQLADAPESASSQLGQPPSPTEGTQLLHLERGSNGGLRQHDDDSRRGGSAPTDATELANGRPACEAAAAPDPAAASEAPLAADAESGRPGAHRRWPTGRFPAIPWQPFGLLTLLTCSYIGVQLGKVSLGACSAGWIALWGVQLVLFGGCAALLVARAARRGGRERCQQQPAGAGNEACTDVELAEAPPSPASVEPPLQPPPQAASSPPPSPDLSTSWSIRELTVVSIMFAVGGVIAGLFGVGGEWGRGAGGMERKKSKLLPALQPAAPSRPSSD